MALRKNKNPSDASSRDFLYLDVERLKSILAQVDGGYLEQINEDRGSTKAVESNLEGTVPLLARIGGKGEYLWTNQSSETRTLHDHIYAYVEDKLLDSASILVLNEGLSEQTWLQDDERRAIPDTSFVLVKGRPLISDYRQLKTFLADFNKIGAAIGRLAAQSQVKELPSEKQRVAALKRAASNLQLPEQQIKDLVVALNAFVKQDVVLRLFPFESSSDARVIASLDVPQAYRMTVDSIVHRFGSAPRAKWTIFGQITAVPLSDDPQYRFSSEQVAGIESALQSMFDQLRTFEALATSVIYPEISVVPIAIYRG